MKKEWDKRLFLILLISVLAVLIIISNTHEESSENKENRSTDSGMTFDNKSLSIKVENDIVYIDGKGRLEREDLEMLLSTESLSFSDVKNIIIGDEINEMGYDCIIGLEKLETLKIGTGIKHLNNGCIRSCPNLKFIYIPKSVEKIGKDFLVYSTAVALISDGDNLDTLIRTDGNYLYQNVSSYENLKEKIKQTPVVYKLDAETELVMDDPEIITEALRYWW